MHGTSFFPEHDGHLTFLRARARATRARLAAVDAPATAQRPAPTVTMDPTNPEKTARSGLGCLVAMKTARW
jgi:hypothetical protein